MVNDKKVNTSDGRDLSYVTIALIDERITV